MLTMAKKIEGLCHRTKEYHSGKNDTDRVIEDLENEGKLGQRLLSVDSLDEVDIGDG
jgi:hypothetical protein